MNEIKEIYEARGGKFYCGMCGMSYRSDIIYAAEFTDEASKPRYLCKNCIKKIAKFAAEGGLQKRFRKTRTRTEEPPSYDRDEITKAIYDNL